MPGSGRLVGWGGDAVSGGADAFRSGGYRVREIIGRGTVGEVWRADHLTFDRELAVKVLNGEHHPKSLAAGSVYREAQITAQLMHPGLPAAVDLGQTPDGRPFFVTELIEGRTLTDIIRNHLAPESQSIHLFEGICQAVGHAHRYGVIHSDLEPSNVMLGVYGEVKVIDWGLSKLLPGGQVTTRYPDPGEAAVRLGIPAYMSPEQARGYRTGVDERSDVFGLGALLCFMLTGQPPYTGADESEVRQKACAADLRDAHWRLEGSGAGRAVIDLCRRCLSADPKDRPADALEVAQQVTRIRMAT